MRNHDDLRQALRRRATEARVSDDAWSRITRQIEDRPAAPVRAPTDVHRGVVIAVAFAVFAAAAVLAWRALAPSGSVTATSGIYRDPAGWSIRVLPTWHAVPFVVTSEGATYRGVEVSNVVLPAPQAAHGTPLQVSGNVVGARGIGLVIATSTAPERGEQPMPSRLSLDDLAQGSALAGQPSISVGTFSARGLHFVLTVKWGPGAFNDAGIRKVDTILRSFRLQTASPTTSVIGAPQSLIVMNQNSDAVAVRAAGGRSHIVQTYPLGAEADVAPSPDGSRLYGAGWITNTGRSRFFVYDTASGRLLSQIPLPDWAQYTGFLTDEIAASPDGNRVYVWVHPFGGQPFSLATYDVPTASMLRQVAPLQGCAPVSILPEFGQNVIVVCQYQNEVRFLQVSSSGALASQAQLTVPTSGSTVTDSNGNSYSIGHVAQAMLSPDGSILYVVTQDGSVFVIDVTRHTIERTIDLTLPPGDVIAVAKAELSADGQALVLGLSSSYPGGDISRADTLMVIDTSTWHATVVIRTRPFTSFAISADGSKAFTTNSGDETLEMVELAPGGASTTLGKVGTRPLAIYDLP